MNAISPMNASAEAVQPDLVARAVPHALPVAQPSWVLVRTARDKEVMVYRAIIDLVADAWLPHQPRYLRKHQGRTEKWVPVLPGYFFAKGAVREAIASVAVLPRYQDEKIEVVRDSGGKPVNIPESIVLDFRNAIDLENAELVSLAGRRVDRVAAKQAAVRRKPSRRLKKRRTPSRRLKKRRSTALLRAEVARHLGARA